MLTARACYGTIIILACPLHLSWGAVGALLHTQGLTSQCKPVTGAPLKTYLYLEEGGRVTQGQSSTPCEHRGELQEGWSLDLRPTPSWWPVALSPACPCMFLKAPRHPWRLCPACPCSSSHKAQVSTAILFLNPGP